MDVCYLYFNNTKTVELKHLGLNERFVLLGDTVTQFEGTNDIT
jgi:hypothetical protein